MRVLKLACDTFKDQLMKLPTNKGTLLGCDPWRYLKKAQLSKAIFRAQFLKPNTIEVHVEHNDQESK